MVKASEQLLLGIVKMSDINEYKVSQNHKDHLIFLYESYPVKDLSRERSKLIQNVQTNYPNGVEICHDGMVNIFMVNVCNMTCCCGWNII
jgi:hypothetical protein